MEKDLDFIAELDRDITNLGIEKVWKRTICGYEISFSPISHTSKQKINEIMLEQEAGAETLSEAKRLTLSHAIVGIGKHDLKRYHLTEEPVFSIKNREGKTVKVCLSKYLYDKVQDWDDQLFETAFDVYSDLMETHEKESVKDVEFQNMKNPVDELGELMIRVTLLRRQLGLPDLVEAGEQQVAEEPSVAAAPEAPEEEPAAPEPVPQRKAPNARARAEELQQEMEEFDPFKAVEQRAPRQVPPQRQVQPQPAPRRPAQPPPHQSAPPDRPVIHQRTQEIADELGESVSAHSASSHEAPHAPRYAAAADHVIETSHQNALPVAPPVIDRPPVTSVNPRFARPPR